MMLVSMISYVDRNTIALLAPTILADTHLNNEQYGYIILVFSLVYMVMNPVWGGILDRVGVRTGMLISVSLWTAASAGHAFASGFRSFAAARGVLGFGEGATFPGALRTVLQTLPEGLRSRGIAVAYSGGSFGALMTPILITPIARRWGWQGAFWFTGAIGAAWLVLWAALARRSDLRLPPARVKTAGPKPRWTDARLWGFIAAYAMGGFPSGFILYQAANFFSATMHKSQVEIGHVLWIPPLGWELGYFFWGWVMDRFAKGGASVRAMRGWLLAAMVAGTPLAAISRVPSFAGALALMFVVMFVSAGFIIGGVAYATSYYSMGRAGWIAGIGAGAWSAVVGSVMPMMGRLFDGHRYDAAFGVATLIPMAGWALWRALDGRRAGAGADGIERAA